MVEQPDLSDEIRTAIENHGEAGGEVDRIETRKCASDYNDGIEYSIYGHYVPIRPIINMAADMDGFAIEELSYIDESSEKNDFEPHVSIFLADIRDEPARHPAFTTQHI